jgi:ABC-2 type transport system ATP-binding protein
MQQDLAIEIKGLRKIYPQSAKSGSPKEALKSIDLQIKKGSFFGLLGPNGAGKSTIINILAGLVNKTAGSAKICGFDLDINPIEAKYKIGIVPQELIIDPFFNVFETLEIYASYYGIRKKQRRTLEIIEALGLQDKIKSKPRSLSGGMKRRLLVAKALVHSPEVLILDEPTAGVDVELRTQLWNYVKKLNEQGTTILLTTHYLEEAEELCDEIAIINKGEVVTSDKKSNLMKLLDTKQLIINLKENTNLISEDLKQKFDLKIIDENQILINYKPQKMEVAEILTILQNNNLRITDISTKQPDLEDIFKFLTKNV